MKTNKIALGIIMEKWLCAILTSIFKTEEGYRVWHVDWNNYNRGNVYGHGNKRGHGQDLRVFQRNQQILAIECKNWRTLNRPYGTTTAITEILDRFKNHAGGIKLLVITTLSLLTKKAIKLLIQNNIHIIETFKLIGKNDFPRKGHFARLFYQIKQEIKELINAPKKVLSMCGVVQCKLVNSNKNVNTGTNTCHINMSLTHDTDSKKELVKTHQNSLVERISDIIKQARKEENHLKHMDSG